MKLLRHIIGCQLALGFALAGMVGLNPALHRWIEHGGRGPSHTHAVAAFWHEDGDGRWHQHTVAPENSPKPFSHVHDFELPVAPLGKALLALNRLFHGEAGPESSRSTPGHQHHSLPEMLLGGAVDQCAVTAEWAFVFVPDIFRAPTFALPSHGRLPDSQTLGRGPPAV